MYWENKNYETIDLYSENYRMVDLDAYDNYEDINLDSKQMTWKLETMKICIVSYGEIALVPENYEEINLNSKNYEAIDFETIELSTYRSINMKESI